LYLDCAAVVARAAPGREEGGQGGVVGGLGLGQVVEVQRVEEIGGGRAVFFLDVFGVVAEYGAGVEETCGYIVCLGEPVEVKLDLWVGRVAREPGNTVCVARGSCLNGHASLAGY
jgi:sirohydrochlorin ferrochelatase